MKILFSLFVIVLMTKECDKCKDSTSTKPEDTIEETSEENQLQDHITLEYKAISRGFYNQVKINHSTILVEKSRNLEAVSKACSKDDWNKLMSLLNEIDLKNISELKAPTQARFYDGAATAQLIIIQENVTFESSSFDHGTPPKEIETLVKEILTIIENIE